MFGAVESVFLIGVWARNDVRDPVTSSYVAHFRGHFPRAGTVVRIRQDMCMNVDHGFIVNTAAGFGPTGITVAIAAASDNGNT